VIGHTVILRQGAAQSVEADQTIIRQGAVGQLNTGKAEFTSSTVGVAQSQNIEMNTSRASGLLAKENVSMDQSGVQILVSGGPVKLNQSGAVVLVAREVELKDTSGVVFLIARNVSGNITPLFGTKEAAIFGAVAGLVGGFILLLSRLFKSHKNR
jgi:hypothetical protein